MKLPRWIMPVMVVAAGWAVYANSLSGPFIFDDHQAIPENPHVRSLWPLISAMRAPDQSTLAGRPLVSLSFALNHAVGGFDVRGYHAVNILLHVVNALLIFGIVGRTIRLRRDGVPPVSWQPDHLAFYAALLWTVHPLQTEAVSYIVQRTELMAGCCLLLTLYAFIRSCASTRPARWQAVSVVACALGVGCKESIVAAPVLVAVYDHVFVSGSIRTALRQRAGLYTGLVATWFLLALVVATGPRADTVAVSHGTITPWTYLLTQTGAIAHYLRLSVWPVGLTIDYDDWPIARGLGDVWMPGLLVAGLIGLTIVALRRRSAWGFVGALFFVALAPTSSFVPIVTEVMAERRMYLPLASVVVAVVCAIHWLAPRGWPGWIRQATASLLALILAIGTIHRNRDYRTETAIYEDAVVKRPGNARARHNLGATLIREGDIDRGIDELRQTLAIRPGYADAHHTLGVALAMRHQDVEAAKHLAGVLALDDTRGPTHYTLAVVLGRQGRWREAARHFARAAQLLADPIEAVVGLGVSLANMGQLDQAIPMFQYALQLRPGHPEAQAHLDRALRETTAPVSREN
jgi:Tfp pilus assembly protein PilF